MRAIFISSADGSAQGPDGPPPRCRTRGDRRVFELQRSLCDVVLVGAGTARVEGYRPVAPSEVDVDPATPSRSRGHPADRRRLAVVVLGRLRCSDGASGDHHRDDRGRTGDHDLPRPRARADDPIGDRRGRRGRSPGRAGPAGASASALRGRAVAASAARVSGPPRRPLPDHRPYDRRRQWSTHPPVADTGSALALAPALASTPRRDCASSICWRRTAPSSPATSSTAERSPLQRV